MPTVAASNAQQIPPGYNNDNRETLQFDVGAASAADTITATLPARWLARGASISGYRCEQFATAAAGARTKTDVPLVLVSFVEATGVASFLLGATAITLNGRLHLTVLPSI